MAPGELTLDDANAVNGTTTVNADGFAIVGLNENTSVLNVSNASLEIGATGTDPTNDGLIVGNAWGSHTANFTNNAQIRVTENGISNESQFVMVRGANAVDTPDGPQSIPGGVINMSTGADLIIEGGGPAIGTDLGAEPIANVSALFVGRPNADRNLRSHAALNATDEGTSVRVLGNGSGALLNVANHIEAFDGNLESVGEVTFENGADILLDGGSHIGVANIGRGPGIATLTLDGAGTSMIITGDASAVAGSVNGMYMGTDSLNSLQSGEVNNVFVRNGASLSIGNGNAGSGELVIGDGANSNDMWVTTGGTLQVDGNITLAGPRGADATHDGFLLVDTTGTVTAETITVGDGLRIYPDFLDSQAGLINSGTVTADIEVRDGGLLLLGDDPVNPLTGLGPTGLIDGDVTMTGGWLKGNGSITGTLTANAGSTVDFGFSPGSIIASEFILEAGATLMLQIGLNADGSINADASDSIFATAGTISILGEIVYDFVNAVTGAADDIEDILDNALEPLNLGAIFQLQAGAGTGFNYSPFSQSFVAGGQGVSSDALNDAVFDAVTVAVPVPEPSALFMALTGLLFLVYQRAGQRRRRSSLRKG